MIDRPRISVVMGTFQRGHLLRRSLESYANQLGMPTTSVEVIVIDDDSTDETLKVCDSFRGRLDLKYLKLYKGDLRWRDSASFINLGIKLASTDGLIVCTHPEVIPGPSSLRLMYDISELRPDDYVCCKPYYLSAQQQAVFEYSPPALSDVETARAVMKLVPAPPVIEGNPDYSMAAVDAAVTWESWVFGGLRRAKWFEIGGMWPSDVWGAVDVIFHQRRMKLGIRNTTLQNPRSYCVHQNHDDPSRNVTTPRDMKKCMDAAAAFSKAGKVLGSFL